jgi:hypothetical protein
VFAVWRLLNRRDAIINDLCRQTMCKLHSAIRSEFRLQAVPPAKAGTPNNIPQSSHGSKSEQLDDAQPGCVESRPAFPCRDGCITLKVLFHYERKALAGGVFRGARRLSPIIPRESAPQTPHCAFARTRVNSPPDARLLAGAEIFPK